MNMKNIAFMIALAGVSGACFGQAVCDRLNANIESNLKDLAFERTSGLIDNSAPRETNRQLKASSALAAIQLTINQQQIAKCKPYVEPVTGKEYEAAASKCYLAFQTGQKESIKDACDRSIWAKAQ
jgi:hypothetical protein